MDYAYELPPIPLQKEITTTGTHHSESMVIPSVLLDAMEAWRLITDIDERRKVGANIARQMEELYGSCATSEDKCSNS